MYGTGLALGSVCGAQIAQWGWWGRLIGFYIALCYFGLGNSALTRGQTVGKRLMRIRVVGRDGQPTSLTRSFVRAAILELPFFLNGLVLPPDLLLSPIGSLIGWVVVGVGGGLGYYYTFNRISRQSLHDLLCGTYVVEATAEEPLPAIKVSRLVNIGFAIFVVGVVAYYELYHPTLVSQRVPPELLALQQRLNEQEEVAFSTVMMGGSLWPRGEQLSLRANIFLKFRPSSFEAAAEDAVYVILENYPDAAIHDLITIRVSYGYDLGIAWWYDHFTIAMAPDEWRERFVADRIEEELDVIEPKSPKVGPSSLDPKEHLSSLFRKELRLSAQGDRAGSKAAGLEALKFAEATFGPDSSEVVHALNNLGHEYSEQGQPAKAAHLQERLVEIQRERLGANHTKVARSLERLAGYYAEARQEKQAEITYRRALAIQEKLHGPDHPNVATILYHLAKLYAFQKEYALAERSFRRAGAIWEKALGPDHVTVLDVERKLARLLERRGGPDKGAGDQLQELVARQERAYGPDHPEVAFALGSLGRHYFDQEDYSEAEKNYRRAVAILQKGWRGYRPTLALYMNTLAVSYFRQSRYTEAEPLLELASNIEEQAKGPLHPDLAIMLFNLSRVYVRTGKEAEAKVLAERAMHIFEAQGLNWQEMGHVHRGVRLDLILEDGPWRGEAGPR